ncbi:MAG: hypothetical protein GC152_15785 [Alphaproteobacteria bacterium]|nr:hypothetical protein [Alphaproteobacteria bacterium]
MKNLVVAALSFAAVALGAAHAAPQPIVGGSTAVSLTSQASNALAGFGIAFAPINGSPGAPGVVLFDITGGVLDLTTLAGTIEHAGAGVSLTRNDQQAVASNLLIDTVAQQVFADVTFDSDITDAVAPVSIATNTAIFDFDLATFDLTQLGNLANPQLPLFLSAGLIALLDTQFDVQVPADFQFASAATAPEVANGVVPLPGALGLFALGAGVFGFAARRKAA